MRIKNKYFDTYESNNFPLNPKIGARQYIKDYKISKGTYEMIRWCYILSMLGVFTVGLLVLSFTLDYSGYLSGAVIGGSLYFGLFIAPELVVRFFIRNGTLTPPKKIATHK